MMNINELLARMTLEEKIGQLTQYNGKLWIHTAADETGPMAALQLSAEAMSTIGSVLNFKNADEAIAIQKQHMASDRNEIPLLFMMDVIHGYCTIYPIPLAMGCSFDLELMEACSAMAAKEAAASGVHVTFAPMVDHCRDARWGRVMESCGEDPLLNGRMGAAQIRGYRGKDLKDWDTLATCVKHFAAYGGAEGGRDYNQAEISEHTLREQYLPAYRACLDAGADMLMPSFNLVNGVPAVANTWLMNRVLRQEWGADPVVISDHSAIKELMTHGVAADRSQAAAQAFRAGCHIDMCSNIYMHELKELVEQGVISQDRIDAAVLRVLQLKEKLGLFEDACRGASAQWEAQTHLAPAHRTLARQAAAQSAVLLKNDGLLPLSRNVRKIACIGPFAQEQDILGAWSCHGNRDDAVSVEEGLRIALPQAQILTARGCDDRIGTTDTSGFRAAIDAARAAEAVILCLGERREYSGESKCRTDLSLPGVQIDLARAVIEANPNTAVVLFTGRPLVLTELDAIAPAILNMWFPGTEGGNAAADLLLGKVNPSGKVTMSFPKAVGQCPIYYNRTNTGRPKSAAQEDEYVKFLSCYLDCGNLPLYAFGYGLSYSRFVYEELSLSKPCMTAGERVEVTVTVYNDSDRAGKETVLLFMRDVVGSTARPVQQLVGFQKAAFAPYERKTFTFTVDEPMLRFWDREQRFISEPGIFRFSTGWADHLMLTRELELK